MRHTTGYWPYGPHVTHRGIPAQSSPYGDGWEFLASWLPTRAKRGWLVGLLEASVSCWSARPDTD
jgi:hypothetical protein